MIYNADTSGYLWVNQKKASEGEDASPDWITAVELGDYTASLVDGGLSSVVPYPAAVADHLAWPRRSLSRVVDCEHPIELSREVRDLQKRNEA